MDGEPREPLIRVEPDEFARIYHNLPERLSGWVTQKSIFKWGEYHARHGVRLAALADYYGNLKGLPVLSKEDVKKRTEKARVKIDKILAAEGAARKTYPNGLVIQKDSDGAWVIQENVKIEGKTHINSEARISSDGDTGLILDFSGPEYVNFDKGINKNPQILDDPRFPGATVEVFNLLASTIKEKK